MPYANITPLFHLVELHAGCSCDMHGRDYCMIKPKMHDFTLLHNKSFYCDTVTFLIWCRLQL